jgi:hypothetical protein
MCSVESEIGTGWLALDSVVVVLATSALISCAFLSNRNHGSWI